MREIKAYPITDLEIDVLEFAFWKECVAFGVAVGLIVAAAVLLGFSVLSGISSPTLDVLKYFGVPFAAITAVAGLCIAIGAKNARHRLFERLKRECDENILVDEESRCPVS